MANNESKVLSVGRRLENSYSVHRFSRLEQNVEWHSGIGRTRVKAATAIVHEVSNQPALALCDPTGSTGKTERDGVRGNIVAERRVNIGDGDTPIIPTSVIAHVEDVLRRQERYEHDDCKIDGDENAQPA